MRLPGVPRGPSGHWDCVECGIPRGFLAVLFLFFYPPIPNLNTAAEPTTATGSVAYFRIFFCVAAAGLVCPAWQTRWTGVGCPIGKTMVAAERVAYFAIWRVCGDPCGWCDGACFTCGERSDAPR
ncbi:hypothetical protein TcG_08881 [Trypanosoma cruzi]|nr:hypothetical protein TcG_08881 [Trypanosoma cruzi]